MGSRRVLVALSGGVDSSVCAALLLEQGFETAGAVLDLSPCHEPAVEAAKASADALSIPLHVIREREPAATTGGRPPTPVSSAIPR